MQPIREHADVEAKLARTDVDRLLVRREQVDEQGGECSTL